MVKSTAFETGVAGSNPARVKDTDLRVTKKPFWSRREEELAYWEIWKGPSCGYPSSGQAP